MEIRRHFGILEDSEEDAILAQGVIKKTFATAEISPFLSHLEFLKSNQKHPRKLDILISDLGPFSLIMKNVRSSFATELNTGDKIPSELHESIFTLITRLKSGDLKMILFTAETPENLEQVSNVSRESKKLINEIRQMAHEIVFQKTKFEAGLHLMDALRTVAQ